MKRRKSGNKIPGGRKASPKKNQSKFRNRPNKKQSGRSYEETVILSVLRRKPKMALASRQLMKSAKVWDKVKYYEALHNLERIGEITVDKKHRVTLVPAENDVPAEIVSLSPGFGFARPEAGGEDIFIHGSGLKGAFLGDSVLLTDVKKQEKGLHGRVKRITKRSIAPITGAVRIDETGNYLMPDGALRYPLKISQKDLHGAKDGEKVVVKPLQNQNGDWTHAAIKTVFGDSESAKVCADAIIERYGIPTEFPENVSEQAKVIGQSAVTDSDIVQRLDLRKKTIFTIDGADAKDLDDAISVEKIPTGYKLGVHIADVSHYIPRKSLLDNEALQRGTSVYFADRVIPMLPKELSNGICSLNKDTDKLTFSAFVYFDTEGRITRYHFQKSVIRSKVRGVYSEVNQLFDGTADREIQKKYQPVKRALENARNLADILKEKSKKRGEMELESGELYFVLDENGVCVDIRPRVSGEAEALIEQFMISANRAASMFSLKNKLPFLYRVHGTPVEDGVAELNKLLDSMGIECGELKKPHLTAGDFASVLQRVKGTSRESLVSQRILRTMDKAKYSENETGHFGLALQEYSHFTSPIRRYPDLAIHRIMADYLSGMGYEELESRYGGFVADTAVLSSKNEVRAVSAEREAEDCYAAEYMKGHIGEQYTGVISGMMSKGIFVRLKNGAEGFISLSDFKGRDYEFDGAVTIRDRGSNQGKMVGDSIDITVASSQVSTGRINFLPQQ